MSGGPYATAPRRACSLTRNDTGACVVPTSPGGLILTHIFSLTQRLVRP